MTSDPAPFQFTDAEFYGDTSDDGHEGSFFTGVAIAVLLSVAAGGVVVFCLTLAGV